ncbi:MAG: DedA family protein [Myxococcota bacterium]|nr:DedA family protein [Myxococcota bacterium]
MDYTEIAARLQEQDPLTGYALIAFATFIEYVIPVLPAELLPTLGAIVAAVADWSFVAVIVAGATGSTAGAMLDYAVGRYIVSVRHDTWLHRLFRRPTTARWVELLTTRFARHGTKYILINRFLPPIRMVVFVVAGMARLHPGRVLSAAIAASLVWMLAVVAVGYTLGFQLEAAMDWLNAYLMVSTAVVSAAAIFLLVRARKRRPQPPEQPLS